MTYVSTYLNPADAPSRLTAQMEWSLSEETFKRIETKFGPYDVDLFASKQNYKVLRYYSWYPDPNAQRINALSQRWSQWNNPYCCPPWNLISQNIQKVRRESYNDNSDSVMGISNLVSRPLETSTRRSYNDTGNGDYSRPQKRKISTDGQQTMVTIGLEDQRSSLENQGYNKEAIALLLPNERLVKRRTRNSTI
ncbi:hypothetical protein AYI69_g7593 [Smittium culicis]|uniref:Uncharacterized protein n=1 Tax=Smittium culicis TaxID=133412 RepID=A0A1R1XQW7_9FUNG|nr:hypothetical protein AYI69_g7593 [Smittium culicis]